MGFRFGFAVLAELPFLVFWALPPLCRVLGSGFKVPGFRAQAVGLLGLPGLTLAFLGVSLFGYLTLKP